MFQSTTSIYWTNVKKIVSEAIGPALIDLPKPLVHHCEIAILSLLYNQHFGKRSTELPELSPFPLSYAWCTKYAAFPVIAKACED